MKIFFVLLFTVTLAENFNEWKYEKNVYNPGCDMTKCGQESRLKIDKPTENKIVIEETSAVLYTWKEEEEVIYTRRERFTALCYLGTIFEKSECQQNRKNYPYDIKSAKSDNLLGFCKTGWECKKDECVRSDSDKCADDKLMNDVGPTTMEDILVENTAIFGHTCTSLWMCINKKIKIKPTISMDGWKYNREAMTSSFKYILLDENFYLHGMNHTGWVSIFPVEEEMKPPIEEKIKTRCYSSSSNDIKCLINNNGKEITYSVRGDTLRGTVRNTMLMLTGSIHTFDNSGKKVELKSTQQNLDDEFTTKVIPLEERASSISSLKEVINGIQLTQMQEIYNVMSNRNQIQRVGAILEKTVSFLSKKYPRMIAYLLGEEFKTHWLNDKIFLICPCLKRAQPQENQNCVNDMIYSDGEMIKNLDMSQCRSVVSEKIKDIELMGKNEDLDIQIIDYLPPKESAGESSTWDFLVEMKSRVGSQKEIDFNEKGIRDYINSLIPSFSFKDILLYFSSIVSFVFIASRIVNR